MFTVYKFGIKQKTKFIRFFNSLLTTWSSKYKYYNIFENLVRHPTFTFIHYKGVYCFRLTATCQHLRNFYSAFWCIILHYNLLERSVFLVVQIQIRGTLSVSFFSLSIGCRKKYLDDLKFAPKRFPIDGMRHFVINLENSR